MDNLPAELIYKIFGYMNPADWIRLPEILYGWIWRTSPILEELHSEPKNPGEFRRKLWIRCASQWTFPLPMEKNSNTGRRRNTLTCRRQGKIKIWSQFPRPRISTLISFKEIPISFYDGRKAHKRVWVSFPPYIHPQEKGCRKWIQTNSSKILREIRIQESNNGILVFLTQNGIASIQHTRKKCKYIKILFP